MIAIKWFFFILLLLMIQMTYAANVSLALHEMDLPSAIQLLAKYEKQNVVLSPHISGNVSLSLREVQPAKALAILLASRNLTSLRMGNILYIAPREELLAYKEAEIKWRQLLKSVQPFATQCWQIKYGKVRELANTLQNAHDSLLSKEAAIQVDKRTNTLCLRAQMEVLAETGKLIQSLDVPSQQILIEARLATIDQDFERELGIEYALFASRQSEKKNQRSVENLNVEKHGYSLAILKLADGALLDVKLSALENAGHAELISSPSLFTQNQQPALIEAGEEVPYQEISESGGTAVTFKKAVLGLKVTPQVLPGGKVLLNLQINQDRPSARMVQGVPTISTRQITTTVLVKTGHTIVLGGIYEENQEKIEQGLPFLGKIPVIGWLFKRQNARTSKRELFIFVTPKII